MLYNFSARKGRIICKPEVPEDKARINTFCIGVSRVQNSDWYSIEDCLINRIALDIQIEIPKPILRFKPAGDLALAKEDKERLKSFQQEDLTRMLQLRAPLDANPMGYGKTVEALVWLKSIYAKKICIICPKLVRYQWSKQCDTWLGVDTCIIAPKALKDAEHLVVITNYEQLINPRVLDAFKGIQWDAVVVDEIHRIRNAKSKTTLAIKQLPGYNKLGLSGTPIMNRPDDLWSICHFLNTWYLGNSYWNFVNNFCEIEETFWGKKIIGLTKDPLKVGLLQTALQYFTIRNPPGAVGVGSAEYSIELEMYPEQQKLYKNLKTLAIAELDKAGITVANGMSQLIKLQQITSNPHLFELEKNVKFEWIKDLLEDNLGEKILVFSRFKTTVNALQEYLKTYGVVVIHGDIKDDEREQAKVQFIANDKVQVITGTIGALGESVDGLHTVCHTVIFIDKMWNPEENNQAIGRVLRYLQECFVNVYTLECINTVDGKVGKVNIEKITDIKKVLT